MVKKKKDLDEKQAEFLSQAREAIKDMKDCDFEEFKELMIALMSNYLRVNL